MYDYEYGGYGYGYGDDMGYNPNMGMGVGVMNAPTIINGIYMFNGQATSFEIRAS